MAKLEAEFNLEMDKYEQNKSQDHINIKPKTIREFLAMKMNPKPIESSDEDRPGLNL